MPKYPYSILNINNKKAEISFQNDNFSKEHQNMWDKIKHHSAAYSITGKRLYQEDRYTSYKDLKKKKKSLFEYQFNYLFKYF